MSTHNICFRGEVRKISAFFRMKKAPYLLLCFFPNYAPFQTKAFKHRKIL